MSAKTKTLYSAYDLAEHNFSQIVIFIFMIIAALCCIFFISLPILQGIFFEYFLHGRVYNKGEIITYYIDGGDNFRTSRFMDWGVDIYLKTAMEGRYWFNPIISLILPSMILSLAFGMISTALMPQSVGFMRQKIEREIAILLNRLTLIRYGYEDSAEHNEIIHEIKNADLKSLHMLAEEFNMIDSDLKILYKALIWRDSSLLYRLFHINDGIFMYMRFYFTIKYSNGVLGFVYIGAAVLIIIIGLRGLKFIPPTQPSLILFALGLEFSLLVVYAFTIMYAHQEDDIDLKGSGSGGENDSVYMSSDFGSAHEVEKLLRVFINIQRKKDK